MTSTPGRSPGSARGYINEQKSLRAKLDQILKWTRDLKSTVMKQSCKALQVNNGNTRETIDQIHDHLDDYKRRVDRELGLIHDICDALTIHNASTNGDEENLNDDILEALRRSPTYTSLEQHIDDEKRPRVRVKPRERIHPMIVECDQDTASRSSATGDLFHRSRLRLNSSRVASKMVVKWLTIVMTKSLLSATTNLLDNRTVRWRKWSGLRRRFKSPVEILSHNRWIILTEWVLLILVYDRSSYRHHHRIRKRRHRQRTVTNGRPIAVGYHPLPSVRRVVNKDKHRSLVISFDAQIFQMTAYVSFCARILLSMERFHRIALRLCISFKCRK